MLDALLHASGSSAISHRCVDVVDTSRCTRCHSHGIPGQECISTITTCTVLSVPYTAITLYMVHVEQYTGSGVLHEYRYIRRWLGASTTTCSAMHVGCTSHV